MKNLTTHPRRCFYYGLRGLPAVRVRIVKHEGRWVAASYRYDTNEQIPGAGSTHPTFAEAIETASQKAGAAIYLARLSKTTGWYVTDTREAAA